MRPVRCCLPQMRPCPTCVLNCVSACLLDVACSVWGCSVVVDLCISAAFFYPNFLHLCLVCIISVCWNWPHTLTHSRFSTLIWCAHGCCCHMEMFTSSVVQLFQLCLSTPFPGNERDTGFFNCYRPEKMTRHFFSDTWDVIRSYTS